MAVCDAADADTAGGGGGGKPARTSRTSDSGDIDISAASGPELELRGKKLPVTTPTNNQFWWPEVGLYKLNEGCTS